LKLKLVKSGYQKYQIDQYTGIGSPIQTRADSESRNLDPNTKRWYNNHKIKLNMRENQKNMFKKSEYISKYAFQKQGVTFCPT